MKDDRAYLGISRRYSVLLITLRQERALLRDDSDRALLTDDRALLTQERDKKKQERSLLRDDGSLLRDDRALLQDDRAHC